MDTRALKNLGSRRRSRVEERMVIRLIVLILRVLILRVL